MFFVFSLFYLTKSSADYIDYKSSSAISFNWETQETVYNLKRCILTETKSSDGNTASAIYFQGTGKQCKLNIYQTIITKCTAAHGSAIYNYISDNTFTFRFLCVSNCKDTTSGACIFSTQPDSYDNSNQHSFTYLTVAYCDSINKMIDFSAGGGPSPKTHFSYTNITDCISLSKIFYIYGSNKDVSYSTIYKCRTDGYIFGISDDDAYVKSTLTICNFVNNELKYPNFAFITTDRYSQLTIDRCIFFTQNNVESHYYVTYRSGSASNIYMKDCTVDTNYYISYNAITASSIKRQSNPETPSFQYFSTYNCYAQIPYPEQTNSYYPTTISIYDRYNFYRNNKKLFFF